MRRKQRGSIFILVLGIILAILAIVAATAAGAHTMSQARANRLSQTKARILAESAIQHALSVLDGQSTATVLQSDNWATLGLQTWGQPGTIRYTMNDGTYRVQIVDANSLIDVNSASNAWLTNLPLTQEQIDSLTDWRSAGQTAQSDGAKDTYYNGLTHPYNAKVQNLDSVDELLLVRGWTKNALYDVPTQTTSQPLVSGSTGQQPTIYSLITVDSGTPNTGKTNVGVAGVQAATLTAAGISPIVAGTIAGRAPFTTLGAVLQLPGMTTQIAGPVVNNLTVSATDPLPGKINLNTATQAVLNSIPNMTSDIAQAIISQQSTGFNQLSDLLSVSGITIANAANLVDFFCVGSEKFLIRVVGTVGNTSVALEAVVVMSGTTPRVTKIYEPPFNDMPTRWGWYDVTQDVTTVDPGQVTPAQ
jgi:general secretion pathway protein K